MRKWYVVHITHSDNYLCRGPHDKDGKPTTCISMCCKICAENVRDTLNNLLKE